MKIDVRTNLPGVAEAIRRFPTSQLPFATSVALNQTAGIAQAAVRDDMGRRFNRPTAWTLNSLRIERATKQKLSATVGFKDTRDGDFNNSPMVSPHIQGGARSMKAMEVRLQRVGYLPLGWQVVPGEGAKLDANGNMSRGQITQLLNVLGTYTEAGYNKANAATRAKLAKGTRKSYGFTYWVNPAGKARSGLLKGKRPAKHLLPGVYQRISTPFGSSLKPVLIFVESTTYKAVLPFDDTVNSVVDQNFPAEFDAAMQIALRTALQRQQLVLL